jgi:hypothetical protein
MGDTLQEDAPKRKTKTGIAFGNLRWGKTEPGQERKDGKNRIAVLMGRKRWEGKTPEERSAHASYAGSAQIKGKPRKPDAPRCPCGAMTLKRAEARAGKTGTSKGHLKACRFFKAA